MATTTNYGLTKPANDSDGWGDSVNTNFDVIDTQIKAAHDAATAAAQPPSIGTPTGTQNGTNVTFTVPTVTRLLLLFVNGSLQRSGAGNDYTLSGTTVTFSVAPKSDDVLLYLLF